MQTMRYTSDVPNSAMGAASALMSARGIGCYVAVYDS